MKEFHWRDKTKHLVLSFIISIIIMISFDSFIYALSVIIILTVIKEIYDQFKPRKNDLAELVTDIFYNFVGLGLAYFVYQYLIK